MKRKFTLLELFALGTLNFMVFLFVTTTAVTAVNYFAEFIKKDSPGIVVDNKPIVDSPKIEDIFPKLDDELHVAEPPVVTQQPLVVVSSPLAPPLIVGSSVVAPPLVVGTLLVVPPLVVGPTVIVQPPVIQPPVVVQPPVVAQPPVVQPPVSTKEKVSVLTFGAKGDGVTDDTVAFQKGLDYVGTNNKILFVPNSSKSYIISSAVKLSDDVHLAGTGATVYMKPKTSVTNMFYTTGTGYNKNITFEGLVFRSLNSIAGTGDSYVGSLTSNVQAIYISGVENLTIKNVTMYDMFTGIKIGVPSSNAKNKNIIMDNLNIYASRIPVLVHGITKLSMTNSILDASGGATKFLHCVYIGGGNSDFYFYNVDFLNSPGGGIHIYNGYPERSAPTNMVFDNCTIDNARVGVIIYSAATYITVKNTTITRTGIAFTINNSSNLTFSNLNISKQTVHPISMGLFGLNNASSTTFTDINVDATGITGSTFLLTGDTSDIAFNRLNITNMSSLSFLNDPGYAVKNMIVQNSTFQWKSNVTTQNISFRRSGQTALFSNNKFTNSGTKYSSLANNYSGTTIRLENNKYEGFTALCYSSDYSKTYNNLNLDTNKYDINK